MSEKCNGRVWESHHYYSCSKPGKVEREGAWYCGIHDPQKVAERQAKRKEKWKAESAAMKAKWNREAGIKSLGELTLARLKTGFADNDRDAEIEIARKHGLLD